MKKTLACFLIICMMITVCGCGKSNPVEPSDSHTEEACPTENSVPETAVTESAAKPESDGKITLDDVMNHPVTPAEELSYSENTDGDIVIMAYRGNDDIVVIPDTIDGKNVVSVEKYAFGTASDVKAIRFADSIKFLDESSCAMNKNLEIVVCSSGMETLGISAFQGCANLHTVVLNDGLKKIENYVFSTCTSLKEVEIPDSVTEISETAALGQQKEFTFVGTAGSVAEEAASANGITFRAK